MVDDYTWTVNNGTHGAQNGAATIGTPTSGWVIPWYNEETLEIVSTAGYGTPIPTEQEILEARVATARRAREEDTIVRQVDVVGRQLKAYWEQSKDNIAAFAFKSNALRAKCQCNDCLMKRPCKCKEQDSYNREEALRLIKKLGEEVLF